VCTMKQLFTPAYRCCGKAGLSSETICFMIGKCMGQANYWH